MNRFLRRALVTVTASSITALCLVSPPSAVAADCTYAFALAPASSVTLDASGAARTTASAISAEGCFDQVASVVVEAAPARTSVGFALDLTPSDATAYSAPISWSSDQVGSWVLTLRVTGNDGTALSSQSLEYTVRPSEPQEVKTAPSKPRSLKVTKRTRTSVKISWKAPSTNGGSVITAYRIAKPGTDATVKASTRSYTIKKLKPSRSYAVSVEAKNAIGYSPAAMITAKTKPAAAKHYRSCASLQKVYPHGVGRSGADDSTSSQPVEDFYVSTKLYNMNNGPRNKATGEYDLDRDNDGIACERL
jgi:hypothetical protein